MTDTIEVVTLDWYGTLATHRDRGRRRMLTEYFDSHDLEAAPWNPQVLYDAFVYYREAYKPQFSEDAALVFWIEFTRQLFEGFQVRGRTAARYELHAPAVRDICGPNCLRLYPDVPALHSLKRRGLRLGIISNWHRGLDLFCCEMNLSGLFDVIIASADIGFEKPNPRIFEEAVRRLDICPERIVHVGDLPEDDFRGALAAGFRAILIDRSNKYPSHPRRIASLFELESFVL